LGKPRSEGLREERKRKAEFRRKGASGVKNPDGEMGESLWPKPRKSPGGAIIPKEKKKKRPRDEYRLTPAGGPGGEIYKDIEGEKHSGKTLEEKRPSDGSSSLVLKMSRGGAQRRRKGKGGSL